MNAPGVRQCSWETFPTPSLNGTFMSCLNVMVVFARSPSPWIASPDATEDLPLWSLRIRRDAEDAFHKFNDYQIEGRRLRCDWDVGMDKKQREEPMEERGPLEGTTMMTETIEDPTRTYPSVASHHHLDA